MQRLKIWWEKRFLRTDVLLDMVLYQRIWDLFIA